MLGLKLIHVSKMSPKTRLLQIMNNIAADVNATQGARSPTGGSIKPILPTSATDGLKKVIIETAKDIYA